jgi:N-methylhydantoinase A/oxoprolinase/acetone carboxylase beta subunit
MTGPHEQPLYLGFDTGGTYTDAVLFCEERGVVAKAKALTTRHDLSVGISQAADRVMDTAGISPPAIRLVSMSTTLATNALVEGQGGRVGLVMIGFSQSDLDRDGLKAALGSDPVIFLPGGHDVHGNETRLDMAALDTALPELAETVSAFAVCGYFSTRNPAHEMAVSERIRATADLPVTRSHELTSRLGGPRRALTTLLNARLIPMIDRLVAATEHFLEVRGIDAPLMVVRGDGALVSSGFARQRPIETILSGPAASLVGARHLSGLDDALVADIGGTTTDIAILENGAPRIDPEGATVGGLRTMVEAVAMRTYGLGGDSEVSLADDGLNPQIALGPRRLVSLSLAASLHGDAVTHELERQLRAPNPGRLDGKFAMLTGVPDRLAAGLTGAEARLYATLTATPQPLDRLLSSTSQMATLQSLVARGLAQLSGFTPSDAAHVVGKQDNWDSRAARLGAELFARRRDGRGQPVAAGAEEMSLRVLSAVTRRSGERMLETVLSEDGHDGAALVSGPLVQSALDGRAGIARFAVSLDRKIIGLGASARLHYAGLPALLGQDCIVPEDADVANAIGAVVGQVRISVEGTVTQPVDGLFRVSVGASVTSHSTEEDALDAARRALSAQAASQAREAGSDEADVTIATDMRVATVEGRRVFIDASLRATAAGRPRIAETRRRVPA